MTDEPFLRRYVRLLRDQWLLAAGVVVACLIVASVYVAQQPSRYHATAGLVYLPADAPALDETALDPAAVMASIAGLARTELVLVNAASAASMSRTTLQDSVTTRVSKDGGLIQVTGTASSATDAANRANAVADALARTRRRQVLDVLKSQIATFQSQLTKLGKATGSTAPTIATIQGSLTSAQSQLAAAKGDVQVAQNATPPGSASSPRPARDALIALVIGLILGGLAVLVRDRTDRRPRSGGELEALWGLPVVASIRDVGTEDLLSPATMAGFRMLRSNLLLRGEGSLPRVLLVTSAVESADRSAVAANLSRALAASGRRVVAVSADSRAPALNEKMAVESATGLAEVLEHDVYPTDAVTPVPLDERDPGTTGALDLLSSDSRPEDLSTSLVGDAMEDLLDDLREEYDIVVIDAPALLPASETALLARAPGIATLIVGTVGGAQRAEIVRARARLELAHVQPIGLVVCGSD